MHPRAAELVGLLRLVPHPEGGLYRELFRSARQVTPDGRGPRSALTTIYYLLPEGQLSRWHRVHSDEVWHFVEGEPLELLSWDPTSGSVTRRVLGPIGPGRYAVGVVPAGTWQAARPLGGYTLVGCSVGPGFDFADFSLLSHSLAEAALLRTLHPDLAPLI